MFCFRYCGGFNGISFLARAMNTFEADLANFQNVKWLDYTQNLMDTQKDFFQSNEMFDVILGVGQSRFKAHQLVLSACSDFLKDVLTAAGSASHQMTTILIPDLNPQLIEPLLEFMYTGESFVNSNILSEFLDACSFLRIRGFISYDCLVNGIKLQQDPKHATTTYCHSTEESENGNKDLLVMPQTYDIISNTAVVVDDVNYDIKDFNVECDVSKSSDNYKCQEHQTNEEILLPEYLDEDDEMMVLQTDAKTYIEEVDVKPFANNDTPPSRHAKTYTEATLSEAIEEIRHGTTVVDAAAKFDIPRSTIYSKLRQSKDPVYRKYRSSHLDDAARAVTETGISLKEASQQFDVSKTVLWRTLKKTSNYKPEERFNTLRTEAIEAIQSGDTLISISKRFNIPLATLHRDKVRLHTEGRLPDNCKLTRRESGTTYQKRLRAAIHSCRNGMPQKMASELHKVPKTTIWRHLRRFNQAENAANELMEHHLEDPLDEDDAEQKVEAVESIEILNSFDEDVVSLEFVEEDV